MCCVNPLRDCSIRWSSIIFKTFRLCLLCRTVQRDLGFKAGTCQADQSAQNYYPVFNVHIYRDNRRAEPYGLMEYSNNCTYHVFPVATTAKVCYNLAPWRMPCGLPSTNRCVDSRSRSPCNPVSYQPRCVLRTTHTNEHSMSGDHRPTVGVIGNPKC